MKSYLLPLALITIFFIAGCSSEDDSSMTTNNELQQEIVVDANTYGVFALRRKSISFFDSVATQTGAFATFVRSDATLTANELLNNYRLPLDTCVVGKSAGDVLGIPASGIQRYDFSNSSSETTINAGEVLSLTSPAGTWLEVTSMLVGQGEFAQYYYGNTDNPIVEPAPPSLRLNIPGNEYPTYDNASVPDVESLEIQSPQDGIILQLDTNFMWNATASENTFVRMVAEKNVGSERYELDCMVEDDGEFNIPDSTRLELGDLFKDYSFRMLRTAYTIQQVDNSMLLIMHTEGTL